MTSFTLSLIFLLAAGGQPPADTTTQSAEPSAQPPVAEPAAQPKMICKYEHTTGSRLSKQKICRPEGEAGADQSTALQRQLDKFADRAVQAPQMGN